MKICISSGHGEKIRGAAGPSPWGLDEVDCARRVVDRSAAVLRGLGVEVETYHDNVSDDQDENLQRICDWHNARKRDLDVSVHFNSATFNGSNQTSNAVGTEVFYASDAGREIADEIVDAICAAVPEFPNRGPKHGNLYFLSHTDAVACLIEVCFVNSKSDAGTFNKPEKFEAICTAIAHAIVGEEARPPIEPIEPVLPEPPEPGEPRPPDMSMLPPPSERRVLKKSMTGDDVAVLQRVLGTPWDGDFGSCTHEQVKSFQAAAALASDGIVGPQTWKAVDELAIRMREGELPLDEELTREITEIAKTSEIDSYHWPDRGPAPPGFTAGMVLCFAAALKRLEDGDAAAELMASESTGKTDTDVLAWYEKELSGLGLSVDEDGPDTLRALFVILIGLGMRESSGRYCEGRDMSASNVESTTAEAALLQTSWNINTAHASLPGLLDEFWENPNGFWYTFREGVSPDASDLDCYGSGDGAAYQWLAKYSPLFAVLVTGVGLRTRRQHWGPVGRREVTLRPEANDLLLEVQKLVGDD